MTILIKNVLEPRDKKDGFRVMVDETLPGGLDENKAQIDMWAREIVPGKPLQEFLKKNPHLWDQFEERYIKELDAEKGAWVNMILDKARLGTVTLLYTSGTPERNCAVCVRDYIMASREEFLLRLKKAA